MPIPGLPPRLPAAVVLDMDGTMLDSERVDLDAWRTVLTRRGLAFDEPLHRRLVGRRMIDAVPELEAHYGPALDFAATHAEVRAHWRAHLADHGLAHKPGLGALLDRLDAVRLPRAVATSTGRAGALASLGALIGRVDVLVGGDEVRAAKPAPDIYLEAARRLGVEAAACLAIEDSLPGVAAASAAGMTVVMVPDLVPPTAAVRHVAASLEVIADWLARAAAL